MSDPMKKLSPELKKMMKRDAAAAGSKAAIAQSQQQPPKLQPKPADHYDLKTYRNEAPTPPLTKPPKLKGKSTPAGHISLTAPEDTDNTGPHTPDKTPVDRPNQTMIAKTHIRPPATKPAVVHKFDKQPDQMRTGNPHIDVKKFNKPGSPTSIAAQQSTSKPPAPPPTAMKQAAQAAKPKATVSAAVPSSMKAGNKAGSSPVPDEIQALSAKAQMLDRQKRFPEADAVYKELDVAIAKAGLSSKKESTGGGGVLGYQLPIGVRVRKQRIENVLKENPDLHEGAMLSYLVSLNEDAMQDLKDKLDKQEYTSVSDEVREFIARHVAQKKVKEVVRKKPGGGGYILYAPNKGKKGPAKVTGNFPTKMGAKRAELARYPPKDPGKLARLRKEVERLMKDPKKDDKKKKDQPTPAKKESLDLLHRGVLAQVIKESLREYRSRVLSEGLFKEEGEKTGSEWDEYIKHLSKNSLSSDKKYNSLQRNIDKKTQGALTTAFNVIKKAVGKEVTLKNFGVKKSEELGKVYLGFSATIGNVAVEPIYIYIENGVPKIDLSSNAKVALTKAEPKDAKLFRAELVTVQERVLDEMDDITTAIQSRDKYLNKSQDGIDDYVSKLTPLQISILKQLLIKKYRKL